MMNIKSIFLSLLIFGTHITPLAARAHVGISVSSYDEPSWGSVAKVFGGIALGAAAIAGGCALYEYSRSDDDLLHEARQAYRSFTHTYRKLIDGALSQDNRYVKSSARALGNRINRHNGTPLHNTAQQLSRDITTYRDCVYALKGRDLLDCITWESSEYNVYAIAEDIYDVITNSGEYAEESRYKNMRFTHCHIHTGIACHCY